MRKATTVKPIMWRDPWFRTLTPTERLLWLLFLTGPQTNLSPIQTYDVDEMASLTGLTAPQVRKFMGKFHDAGRVEWCENTSMILIYRWLRHNPLRGPKQESGYINTISAYEHHPFHGLAVSLLNGADPDTLSIEYRGGIDRVSILPRDRDREDSSQKKEKNEEDRTKVQAVVEHLNEVTGRGFPWHKATAEIERAMHDDGATVEDCKAVIDYLWGRWGGDEKMAGHVDKTTPFRRKNFSRYLDEAQAGAPRIGGARPNDGVFRY